MSRTRPDRWSWLAALAWLFAWGCAGERALYREALSDPLMHFEPGRTILSPDQPLDQSDAPLPTNTITTQVRMTHDPGSQVVGTRLDYSLRTAVELARGVGLEGGYGLQMSRERILLLDGFEGPLDFERLRQGPDVAAVYDDGTSVLRAGYQYRNAWDGDSHLATVRARTAVLSHDTVVEIGYRHNWTGVALQASDHTASGRNVDDSWTSDRTEAAIEQGWPGGWNLRLQLAGLVERGLLHSPYRLVSLWCHRPDSRGPFPDVPRVEPEHHPDTRTRWGGMLRVRKHLPALNAAAETSAGYGSGNWRVEHFRVQAGYYQRLGRTLSGALEAGAYHQSRASFYRDDYTDGPPGASWSADRSLSAHLAWWTNLDLEATWFADRHRVWAMFTYLTLQAGLGLTRVDYAFESLDTNNGFSSYAGLAGPGSGQAFDGGWLISAWLGMEGGF